MARSQSRALDHSSPSWLLSTWPLLVALVVLGGLFGVVLFQSLAMADGILVYALDDAYIHMAMAKHFVQDGVWGVTKYGFTSSTSSPLWTLAVSAIFAIAGPLVAVPLALNAILSAALLVLAHAISRRLRVRPGFELAGLLWLVFMTPLVPLAFTGMEHVLQILVDLALVFCGAAALANPARAWDKWDTATMALAFAAVGVRYEGALIVAVIAVLFAVRGRWLQSVCALAAGALPVVAYGLISVAQGWWFLPNSVWLKGQIGFVQALLDPLRGRAVPDPVGRALAILMRQLGQGSHLVALLIVACLLLALRFSDKRKAFWSVRSLMVAILAATTVAHFLVAQTGWFFRYEAYLAGLLGFAILLLVDAEARTIKELSARPLAWGVAMAMVVALVLGVARSADALKTTPMAVRNIYEQQYQMAQFVKSNFEGSSIALNDIGAVNYYADVRSVDLWGLANKSAAQMRLDGKTSPAAIQDIVKKEGVEIAIVYRSWFEPAGGLPAEWQLLERWRVRDVVVLGGDVVDFYAVEPGQAARLKQALDAYTDSLPDRVERLDAGS